MIFPPIFSYIIFFILDFLALVFDVFVLTAPLGVVISFLSTVLYLIITLIRYGPKKTKERLFKFTGVSRKKIFKRVTKVVGGSIIPFVNVWAVHDDYKEDLEEKNKLDLGVVEEKKQGMSLKQKVALGAAVVATGGAATAVVGGEAAAGAAVGGEAIAGEAAIGSEAAAGVTKIPWIKTSGNEIDKSGVVKKKTIAEEVGGIKTGLNREDYNHDANDFSRQEAYANLIEKKRKEKEEKDKKAQKEAELKSMQGIKAEQNLRQEILDKSKRRFGSKAKQTERLEDKYREDFDENSDTEIV